MIVKPFRALRPRTDLAEKIPSPPYDVINSDAIVSTQVGTTNYELAAGLVGEDRIEAFDQFALAMSAENARFGDDDDQR